MEHFYNYFFDENDMFHLVEKDDYDKFKHHYLLWYFENMEDDYNCYEV